MAKRSTLRCKTAGDEARALSAFVAKYRVELDFRIRAIVPHATITDKTREGWVLGDAELLERAVKECPVEINIDPKERRQIQLILNQLAPRVYFGELHAGVCEGWYNDGYTDEQARLAQFYKVGEMVDRGETVSIEDLREIFSRRVIYRLWWDTREPVLFYTAIKSALVELLACGNMYVSYSAKHYPFGEAFDGR